MVDYTKFEFSQCCLKEEEQEQYQILLQIKAAKKAAVSVNWLERASRLREEEKRIAEDLYQAIAVRMNENVIAKL